MRIAPLVAAAVGLLPALAQAAPLVQTIALSEREPLAFLLSTPTGDLAKTSSSEVIRIVSEILRRETDFELDMLDTTLMQKCRGQLSCLTLEARRDYQRKDLLRGDGTPLPYREHVRRLKEAGTAYPEYLLVISTVTLEDADRVSAVLVNTDLALAEVHEAERGPDWRDRAEAAVNSAAVVADPVRAVVTNEVETREFLQELFRERFRPTFEGAGHWQPFGTTEITTEVPDLAISIDGEVVGTTRAGTTRLEKMRPGKRELVLSHPEYAEVETLLDIDRGGTTRFEANPERVATSSSEAMHRVVFWSGVATAVAGAAFVSYAFARQDSDLRGICIGGECSSSTSFVSFGYDPARDPTEVNPSGVLVAPLGYSLVGAGAAWSIGSLLTDDADVPWIAIAAGVLVGAASYGISAAAGSP